MKKSFIIKLVKWLRFPLNKRKLAEPQLSIEITLLDQIEKKEIYYYNQIELNKKIMETFCNQSLIKLGVSQIDQRKVNKRKMELEQNEMELLNRIEILNEIKKLELYNN